MEKRQFKYRCDGCHSILDVPEDRILTLPCPICGNYYNIFYLENSNQLFEMRNGVLCLVPSPLKDEERKANYESKRERNRTAIMGCIKRYKIGDGGSPCHPEETFYVHERDFKKIVDMIISQTEGL